MKTRCFVSLIGLCFALFCSGQAANLLPNGGFEEGSNAPSGWRLVDGAGAWSPTAQQGQKSLCAEGRGEDQSYWRTDPLPLQPGGLYRLSFLARAEGGTRSAIAGPSHVNRDFNLGEDWGRHEFFFASPHSPQRDFVRLGQWHLKGKAFFDAAELLPVQAVHARIQWLGTNRVELGEGESLRGDIYRFQPKFNWVGANYHRPLLTNRAAFNSGRWIFSAGSEVVYRHDVAGLKQIGGRIRLSINYYVSGALGVSVSTNGIAWQTLGRLDGTNRAKAFLVPNFYFPADQIYVRIAAAESNTQLQVDTYDYEAPVARLGSRVKLEDMEPQIRAWLESLKRPSDFLQPRPVSFGETTFLVVQETNSDVEVRFESRINNELAFTLSNRSRNELVARGYVVPGQNWENQPGFVIRPGQSVRRTLDHPPLAAGRHELRVVFETLLERTPLFVGEMPVQINFLDDNRFGYLLGEHREVDLWWCESGWKVSRTRASRRSTGEVKAALSVSAARGEFESAQLVLCPNRLVRLERVSTAPFQSADGEPSPISLKLYRVAYVNVTQPTDASCQRGFYPDPLPPLETPCDLGFGNQPFWVTFYVPPQTKAGLHKSTLEIQTTTNRFTVPLTVRVFDFQLPKQMHLRSAFGLGAGSINRYHHLQTAEDKQLVYEKYLRNFAEHRISPYSFYAYAPIHIQFEGAGTNQHPRLDFTQFDQAAVRWLDDFGFNTFQLPLRGMGGGTFHSRHLGELQGFKEGTPEHGRLFGEYLGQIESHLRERGWLEKAFTYWFDEPDPKDYEFVVAGMNRLKQAAPGLKRMLTEQPEPELQGHVDIWCALTPEWTPQRVQARRAAGEEVWWYICTGPKAPYATEFIDHPGTELRVWPWQSWQYGVTGILVWETVYWTSPLVYPEPTPQNPWTDPMSYVSGYGHPVGHVSPWGNGDGRFLYPPSDFSEEPSKPLLDEPVNSFRWENLRDGIEDYEYLWLLQHALDALPQDQRDVDLAKAARRLLTVPPEVLLNLTHFTTDPRPILQHREKVAEMIERLAAR